MGVPLMIPEGLANVRKLRRMLELADTEHRGIWVVLRERFPQVSLIATADDVAAALDLAYEIGYADGESSRAADAMIEADP